LGGKVFELSSPIFCLKTKKTFGKNMELAGIFDRKFGRFLANLWPFEIQKIWDFLYFGANLATFFSFKMRFWAKLVLEPLKIGFLILFTGPEDGLYINF
jgi:hypothetical protein